MHVDTAPPMHHPCNIHAPSRHRPFIAQCLSPPPPPPVQVTVERDELQRLYADAKARLSKLEGEALEMRSEVEALRDYRQRCARAEHEVRELEERLR